MNIALAIRYLFPDANPIEDFRVEDDGRGQVIKAWRLAEPQPTQRDLETAWVAVQAAQAKEAELNAGREEMAEMFKNLSVETRAMHLADYDCVLSALDRGDTEAARKRLESMPINPDIPEAPLEAARLTTTTTQKA